MTTQFELDWQPYHNAQPSDESTVAAQAKYLFWAISAILLGNLGGFTSGLWTHIASCDSTSSGYDSTNRLGNAYNAAKIVRGNGSAIRSWIVLRGTINGVSWYVLIDYNTANDYQINFTFSKNAFSGGSTTSLPSATNSWTYASQQFVPAILAGQRVFALLSTTGEWHIQFGTVSTSKYTFGLSFFTLAGAKTGDNHNGWSYCEYNASVGVWHSQTTRAIANTTIKGMDKNGTVAAFGKIPRPTDANGTDMLGEIGNSDAVDGAMNEWPAGLEAYTAGQVSLRGRLRDMPLAPTTAAASHVEPLSGPTYDSRVVGTHWMPFKWNATPIL